MSILTSVSDGLALLVSGAAMAAAARALWLASRRPPATPAGTSAATSQPAAEPTPAHPGPADRHRRTTTDNGGTRGRGDQTREQVRAFLADPERAGSDWSLVQVSQGVGRSSATVSYTLDKLMQAGEVELTSPKPRRYTIATSGTGPAEATGQPAEPTGDTTDDVSAPAVAAQARPGRTRGRPAAAAVEAEASKAPAMARAATTARKPKGSSGKATAAAATRKASTKPAATTATK